MKKLSLALTLLTFAALTTNAGPFHEEHAQRIEKMREKTLNELQLDPTREQQVRAIMNETQEQRSVIMREAKAQIHSLHKSQKERLAQILSEDEMNQLEEIKERKMPKMKHQKHSGNHQ